MPSRRRARRAAAIFTPLLLVACGARPVPPALESAPAPALESTRASTGTPQPSPADFAPTGLPGMGPYALLILGGPAVDEIELLGMAYAATTLGWHLTITAPATAALRGRSGLGLPLDSPLGAVDLAHFDAHFDALFVPTGAPNEPAAVALVEAFAAAEARPLFLATNGGLAAFRTLPSLASCSPATRDESVRFDGRRLIGARAGDIPALAHALEAIARDRWPAKTR